MTVKKNSTPAAHLPKEEGLSKFERASNLPKPNQVIPISVPLDLLIHYFFVNDIHPRAYVDSAVHRDDVMISSKSQAGDEPFDRYIEKPA